MKDAGAAFIGIGAVVLLLVVVLVGFPAMEELSKLPAGELTIAPAGDTTTADCGDASSVGDGACNLHVVETSTLDMGLGLCGGVFILIAFAGLLFLLALGLSSLGGAG